MQLDLGDRLRAVRFWVTSLHAPGDVLPFFKCLQASTSVGLVHLLPALDLLLRPEHAATPDGLGHLLRPLVLFAPLEPPALESLHPKACALAKRFVRVLDEEVEGEVPACVLGSAGPVQPLARLRLPGHVQAHRDGALGGVHLVAAISVLYPGRRSYLPVSLSHLFRGQHCKSLVLCSFRLIYFNIRQLVYQSGGLVTVSAQLLSGASSRAGHAGVPFVDGVGG